jgi:hypothetical protein
MKLILSLIAALGMVSAFAVDVKAPVVAPAAPVVVKTAQPPVQAEVNKTKLAAKKVKAKKAKAVKPVKSKAAVKVATPAAPAAPATK